jgi:hypothetical protein
MRRRLAYLIAACTALPACASTRVATGAAPVTGPSSAASITSTAPPATEPGTILPTVTTPPTTPTSAAPVGPVSAPATTGPPPGVTTTTLPAGAVPLPDRFSYLTPLSPGHVAAARAVILGRLDTRTDPALAKDDAVVLSGVYHSGGPGESLDGREVVVVVDPNAIVCPPISTPWVPTDGTSIAPTTTAPPICRVWWISTLDGAPLREMMNGA